MYSLVILFRREIYIKGREQWRQKGRTDERKGGENKRKHEIKSNSGKKAPSLPVRRPDAVTSNVRSGANFLTLRSCYVVVSVVFSLYYY